ncbi:hypothetical protein BROUX41_002412 [Berkeleyomyces rouxiae]|uniref:uncharacterized protein n=1 Tax=Berkeleyomyces rouxiae TaxID=2035830 RepID=UPI003B7DA290
MAAAQDSSKPAHLEPSKLGTREYWDSLYIREQSNHETNPSDKGTVWFDDSNAETKVVRFLRARVADEPVPITSGDSANATNPDADADADADAESDSEDSEDDDNESPRKDLSYRSSSFLDLGCGNGSLLFALRRAGFAGPRLGIDYSSASIAFARQIVASASEADESLAFAEWDVLKGSYADVLGSGSSNGDAAATDATPLPPCFASTANGFDVVLDKGTFDAISLSSETGATGGRVCEDYARRVLRLVRRGGILVITSCNWTEDELVSWFQKAGQGERAQGDEGLGSWVLDGRVNYRVFSFGGVTGQTISTLCFRRV